MITTTAYNRIGNATTPLECLAARRDLAALRVNEAFFGGILMPHERLHFRAVLIQVKRLMQSYRLEVAADVMSTMEYALDALAPYSDVAERYNAACKAETYQVA